MLRRKYRSRKRGQSSAEFALVLPILLGLLFGIIQFGQILYTYSFIAYAAESASRYAMIHSSQSAQPATAASILSYVQGLSNGLNQAQISVTPTWTPNSNPGSSVTIKVSYIYPVFGGLLFTPSGNITLSSTTQSTIIN